MINDWQIDWLVKFLSSFWTVIYFLIYQIFELGGLVDIDWLISQIFNVVNDLPFHVALEWFTGFLFQDALELCNNQILHFLHLFEMLSQNVWPIGIQYIILPF